MCSKINFANVIVTKNCFVTSIGSIVRRTVVERTA